MSIKVVRRKPITNGTRHSKKLETKVLTKNDSIFGLKKKYHSKEGRSPSTGHITSWHRGGGHKAQYILIDDEDKNRLSVVVSITYNAYKTSVTAICFDLELRKFFSVSATLNAFCGMILKDTIGTKPTAQKIELYVNQHQLMLGYRAVLREIPVGSVIHSVSVAGKVTYAKSAGVKAQLLKVDSDIATVKLSSGQLIKISADSTAAVGVVSNNKHYLTVHGKAGRRRNLGHRPIVRGIAMNPVDHPHGGRTNGGRPSVTPWGIPTKSKFKLRKKKKKINA